MSDQDDTITIPAEVELERLWQARYGDDTCSIELGHIDPAWRVHRYPMPDGTVETELDWACELHLVYVSDRSEVTGGAHGADWVEYRWRFSGPTLSACAADALAWCRQLLALAPDEDDE